ncbi:uncharacterized protein LOC129694740, partial [Leucoraja erinacea]|uniref:uncharacterized protein LOC129694740 n=1 Tax=Leucoraja erinaceus TaxID=7782 RepID=UPI002455DDB0
RLPRPSPEGSLGPPLPLLVAGGGASADTVHSNAPGHPLTPPILLAPANFGRPLTRANPPPSPSDRCQRLTHLNRGNPLAPGDDCQPLTHQHQDHPLAPGHHCRPLTHLDQGNRLAHATLSQPLTRPDRDHPLGLADHCRLLTQHDRGQRLAPVAGSDQSRPVGRWGEQRPLGRMAFYPEAPGRGGPLPSPGGLRTGIGTEHGDNEEEVEGGEIPFNIIPIHGITLDDVNEIIRWDLSEVHECLRMEHP